MELDFDRLCLKCMNFSVYHGRCTVCHTSWPLSGKTGAANINFQQEPSYALLPGTILSGKYLLGSVLGCGGFGITYLGLDLETLKKVAVKEYMPVGAVQRIPGQREVTAHNEETFSYGLNRFYDEARTMYRYRGHPNLVPIYKLFRENHTAYYVMEYLEGGDLRTLLRRSGGKVSYPAMMEIVMQILDALEYIHQDGMIHRDISPDNIFVGRPVKLIDFGAARVAFANRSGTLSVILKKGFAPEEQYRKHGRQGPWTDIYALCATMYYCLTGQMVPEAPERLIQDSLADIRLLEPSVPTYSAAAIMKGLAVKAENRYSCVSDFRLALNGQYAASSVKECPIDMVRVIGLRGTYAGSSFSVRQQAVFGRERSSCQVVFPQETPGVSRIHCILLVDREQNQVWLEDRNSTYGTWVNDRKLDRGSRVALSPGDRIRFGRNQLFEVEF